VTFCAPGGNTLVPGTLEYTFPVIEKVRGAIFYDIYRYGLDIRFAKRSLPRIVKFPCNGSRSIANFTCLLHPALGVARVGKLRLVS
jgi:hypothetical protein